MHSTTALSLNITFVFKLNEILPTAYISWEAPTAVLSCLYDGDYGARHSLTRPLFALIYNHIYSVFIKAFNNAREKRKQRFLYKKIFIRKTLTVSLLLTKNNK